MENMKNVKVNGKEINESNPQNKEKKEAAKNHNESTEAPLLIDSNQQLSSPPSYSVSTSPLYLVNRELASATNYDEQAVSTRRPRSYLGYYF